MRGQCPNGRELAQAKISRALARSYSAAGRSTLGIVLIREARLKFQLSFFSIRSGCWLETTRPSDAIRV